MQLAECHSRDGSAQPREKFSGELSGRTTFPRQNGRVATKIDILKWEFSAPRVPVKRANMLK